jgi:hypothetical protein
MNQKTKVLCFVVCILGIGNLFGQEEPDLEAEKKLMLYSWTSNKVKFVNPNKIDYFKVDYSRTDSGYFYTTYNGEFISQTDDSIIIDPSSMSIFKEFTKQDSLVSIDKDFYQFPETQITLAKSSIHYVQKSNYFRYLCYGFTYISISSALIIAPLVGINYKAGGFNSNRYGQVVKYSLLAAASGIAVSFFFPERTYRFSPREL